MNFGAAAMPQSIGGRSDQRPLVVIEYRETAYSHRARRTA